MKIRYNSRSDTPAIMIHPGALLITAGQGCGRVLEPQGLVGVGIAVMFADVLPVLHRWVDEVEAGYCSAVSE